MNRLRKFARRQLDMLLGIPAKLNSIPEGRRTPFRAEGEHCRSEAEVSGRRACGPLLLRRLYWFEKARFNLASQFL